MLRPMPLCLAFAALSAASCSMDAKPAAVSEQPSASCRELAERFQQVLDQGTGPCSHSDDCACYNPVSAGAGCGGVTDAPTAVRLAELEREFHARDCPWPHQCAPWACAPRCDSGRCVN
jgi:hypothetical protein